MIEVLLDNNALEFICLRTRFDKYLSAIERLHGQKLLRVHFNIITFLEQISGITPISFPKAQEYMIKASKLCNSSILLPMKDHVKTCIVQYSEDELRKADSLWRERLIRLCRAASYDILSADLESLRSDIHDEIYEFYMGSIRIKEACKEFRIKVKSAGMIPCFSREDKGFEVFRQFIFDHWIQGFGLNEIARNTPGIILNQRLKPLQYLTDAYIYYNQLLYGNYNPKQSDKYDLLYLLYLNICDYLITRDSKFRSIMDNCGNDELRGRSITPEAFLKMLDKDEIRLAKRAPDPVGEIRI